VIRSYQTIQNQPFEDYYTHANGENILVSILQQPDMQLSVQEQGSYQQRLQQLLWRLFVRRYINNASLETLRNETVLHIMDSGYVGGSNLQSLPPEIGQLTSLRELIIPSHRLQTLPLEIGKLTNLKHLDLGVDELELHLGLEGNRLQTLPPEVGQLANLTHLNLARNQLQSLPHSLSNLRNMILLDLQENPRLRERGEGETLGRRELRQIFGDRVVFSQKLAPITRVTPEQVFDELDKQPLRINRKMLIDMNPPEIPVSDLDAKQFMNTFETMVEGLNFRDKKGPGYIDCTLLTDFRADELEIYINEALIKTQILPRLRGFLKTLAGLPLEVNEPKGWQMFDAQKPALKNALAYIFKEVIRRQNSDPGTASVLFVQLTNGLLHCPAGQKEGVDSVILSLQGGERLSSDFIESVKMRIALKKNDVWPIAILPGENTQNVHILSRYAGKTKEYLNIYSALGTHEEITNMVIYNDPFHGSVGNVLEAYFQKFTPQYLITYLKSLIKTFEDEQLQQTISAIEKDILKGPSATRSVAEIEKLKNEKAKLTEKRKERDFERPFNVGAAVVPYLQSQKLIAQDDSNGSFQGWKNYFDHDPYPYYIMLDMSLNTFPNLTEAGAKRILLHLGILEGNELELKTEQAPLVTVHTAESPVSQFCSDFVANQKVSYVKASPGVFVPETTQAAWKKLLDTQGQKGNSAVAAAMSLNTAYQHAAEQKTYMQNTKPIATHLLYSAARLVSGQTVSLNANIPLTDKIKDTYFLTAFNVGQDVRDILGTNKEVAAQDVIHYLNQCFAFNPEQKLDYVTNQHRFILTLAALASYYGKQDTTLDAFRNFAKGAFASDLSNRIDAALTTFRTNFERLLSCQYNEQAVSYNTIKDSSGIAQAYSLPLIKVAKPLYIKSRQRPINFNLKEAYTNALRTITESSSLLPAFINQLQTTGAVFTSLTDISSMKSLLMYYLAKDNPNAIDELINYQKDLDSLLEQKAKTSATHYLTIIEENDLYLKDDTENPYLFNQAPPQ